MHISKALFKYNNLSGKNVFLFKSILYSFILFSFQRPCYIPNCVFFQLAVFCGFSVGHTCNLEMEAYFSTVRAIFANHNDSNFRDSRIRGFFASSLQWKHLA